MKIRIIIFSLLLAVIFLDPPPISANEEGLPSPTIPDGMGISMWGATDEILGGLYEAGFRCSGEAFFWAEGEKQKGKYDFSSYEQTVNMYKRHGFRLFIGLGGGNELYGKADTSASPYGESMAGWALPKSEEARKALVRWAVETIRHFKGRGIVWFLFGEPEAIGLSPEEYCWFNVEVGKILKKEMPEETFSGPGTAADMSNLPATVTNPKYFEGCIKAGCLKYWDLLIFQTYLWDTADPEEVSEPLKHIRELTAAHKGKPLPISTTLGYPSDVMEGWMASSEEKQAKMLARIFLTDQLNHMAMTFWYTLFDYEDPDPTWNFYGLYRKSDPSDKTLKPKPAYFAAKAFSSLLKGFRFKRRLTAGKPEDYVLEFTDVNDKETRYAVWTRSGTPSAIRPRLKNATYQFFSHLGDKLSSLKVERGAVSLELSDAPVYLIPVPEE